jgi:long-chain acyl-CoA synthetase
MINARSVDAMTAADVLRGLPSRLHQVYEPHLRATPDHIAFADTNRTWTYRQFADAVDAVAREFRDIGIRPGDRVMIVSENSTALGACVYAASKIDAWPCVTNSRLSAREVDLIAAHSDARRLIFMTGVSSEAAAHAERRRAEPRVLGPFDGIAISELNVAAKPEPTHEDRARQVAALIYTSGTTGTPKGVMLSHENLLFTGRTTVLIRDLAPHDRVYGVLPMSHIVGLSSGLVATMMAGATLMPVPRFDPGQLARAVAGGDVTILAGVPATYQRLLAHKSTAGLARLERGRLRIASVAGARLDLTLKARVESEFGLPLINAFGITECSPGISTVRPRDPSRLLNFSPTDRRARI